LARIATFSSAHKGVFWTLVVAALPVLAAAGADSAVDIVAIGRQIFFDTSLSASGRMSCANCHIPTHAYGPPNGLAVQRGGPKLNRQGARAVPTLRYALNISAVGAL
jgi:cytochrome c peroxidase